MTTTELKEQYFKFFEDRGHSRLPSYPLIPENDPTALFTTAGMHPLIPYLMGENHPAGTRLVDVQKCIRTGDIDEVGDDTHLTLLEMLGNWSLGDYYKKEAIEWSFEFLTQELKISVEKIYITCFEGDQDVPRDEESAQIWQEKGILADHIFFLGKKDNFWGPVGQEGPCGPDTEIFYYVGQGEWNGSTCPGDDSGDFVEIWNNVFMGYQRKAGREPGQFEYLEMKQKNVDTGMGVERAVAVLDGYSDVYRIDSIWELVETVMNVLKVPEGDFEEFYQDHKKSLRILVDHLRAATFILGDERGVTPSNLDQGYILRRLIRRAVRHAKKLEIPQDVCISSYLGKATIDLMSGSYPELERNRKFIIDELFKEEEKFEKTLERGLKEFEKLERVTGQDAFMLFSTYGFPLELTEELSEDKGLKIDKLAFAEEFKKHQDLSRKGGEKRFKGGLGDDSEMSKKYHTATHLLHQALKEVLGDHVEQKGSNITAERLRFDFSHPEKLTDEEKQKVEELVNQKISEALPITIEELTVDEAKASGAIGLFSDRYGDKVKVYSMGEYSKEICGGPHVKNTKDLGKFKIKKEKASSSGVRRIKAILE